MKLWDKGYSTDAFVEEFTVGRDRELDLYLAEADVLGNMAHMKMLNSIGLISDEDRDALTEGLKKIYKQVLVGDFTIEEGVDYVTTTFGTSYFAIERGRTPEQQEFAAFMLEALNYYSYTMVKDIYYEKTLKLQYGGADRHAKDMIDMVIERAYLDFAYISGAGGLMGSILTCTMDNKSLSSVWMSSETSAMSALEEYLNGYLK